MNPLDAAARGLGALGDAARAAGRTVLPVDANPVPGWTHVTKVDPEPDRRLPLLYPLYLRHTDAVSVGGSSGVTAANTEATFDLLAWTRPPAFHEPSDPEHITDRTREQAAFLAIPEVLNGDVVALVGDLGAGIERLRDDLVPGLLAERLPDAVTSRAGDALAEFATSLLLRRAVFEAYVVNNPDSAAAERSGVGPDDVLGPGEACRRALAADRHLGSEVVYLEYSGTYGGREAHDVLRALDGELPRARVWYGGGLDAREPAETTLAAGADAIVVGNAFHAVAEEEAELCAAAVEELPADADREAVAAWLRERGPIEETAAAGFLATNPAVGAPADRAANYLVMTVRAVLGIYALTEDAGEPPADPDGFADWANVAAEGPPPGEGSSGAAAGPLPGERAVAPVLPEERDARAYGLALAATVLGVEAATDLPVDHLALVGRAPEQSAPVR